MIQIKRILLAAVSALLSLPLAAQVPFTGSYSQNFDAMGTGTAPPTGWSHIGTLGGSNSSWATIIPASGSLSAASAGTPNNTLIASTSFTSSIKSDSQAYNFALGTSTADRSLGTSPTSGAGNILQLRLTNNTVAAVSAIRIGYDIRRFTAPGANQLPGYWLFYSIDGGTTWTNVSALNPAASGATVNVPNSTGVTSVPLTTVTFPSSVAISSEIRLRWVDDNAQETSPDQIIGLDNVSIQLPVVNALPTATLTAPAAGATFDAPATVNLTATATDTDGTISKVEFFNGATKLGEDTTDPYEFSWNNVVTGSYALTAVATDNLAGTATSSAVNITVTNADNVAPSVTLTAPANGATILTDSITLTATAADTDGTVTKVEFFNGATKLGEDTTSPYAFNWTGVATGNYSLTAKATDNDGGTTTSSAANISVAVPITSTLIAKGATWKFRDNGTDQGTAWKETGFDDSAWPAGPAPLGYGDSHIVTTVYSPAAPNRYITTYFRRTFNVSGAAAIQALNMNILRDDGVIVYINGTEVARQNMPAGAFDYLTWSSDIVSGADETTYFPSSAAPMPILVDGDNTIAVELHQRDGTSSDLGLDMELISVALPGTPPTVALTAPADGASFTAPATIAITADAADTDGTVTKVEFFEGANKLGEDTVAPYTFEWTIVPQGTYTLTAKATDNFGQSTTSDAVNITVAPPNTLPPTVAITTPANNASFTTPASITISADAADSDGTVSKVEFFNGATKLGEAASEPYTYNWSNVAVGDYTLTAVATDNLTATTTSSAVVIHVLPNQPPTISQTAPADLASVSAPAANLQVALSDPESQALTVTFYGREKTATAGADFTLVTLPDTQFYSSNASYFSNFTAQTQWIVDQRNALNIAFVSHMGDMTDGASAPEYVRADTAMKIIEDPAATGLPSGIPWGGAPGNHDSSGWDTTFGPSRFAGRSYFQGNYPSGSAVNSYQFFTAGGMNFVHINLAMYPTTAALGWADAILKANANRRAIVTEHSILNVGGSQTSWTAEGTTVYDALKGNPNLFLMLCGHMHGIGRRVDTYNGNTIYSVLQDYQDEANGGDSWLRYFTFSPANNKITANVIRCRDAARRTDSESQFEMPYAMQGSAPWTTLGTVNIAAGGTSASLPWTGLSAGTQYEWYATVTDGVTPVTSATRSFTAVTPTSPPTVALTAPADGASFTTPASITLTADAADSDGSVAKVEFFDGANKLGEATAAPYSFDWTSVPVGDHMLTAVATDNLGLTTVSAAVVIHVAAPNQPPTVALTAPADGTSLIAPASTTLTATAADSDGSVSKVEFFDGATKLGEASTAPYAFDWSNIPVGGHVLTALATDNLGLATTSATVTVTVTLPTVTIAATRASAGEYGTGRTLEFTVSRTGPTTSALVVPLVAGGTATAGTDYSGSVSSVTIPAGSAAVAVTLTVLPDNLVEGTETATVSLGTSAEFTAGSPASANAAIADSPAPGTPWSFGVMADTQLTGYPSGGTNGVSTDIIDAVNQQFIARGVDFVIQVGDLCESGGASQLQTRLDHNAALTAAGIKFFGLRGNHEGDATSKTFFQSNFIPGGSNVEVAPFDSASYAVNWKGCKFVLLDYPTSTSTSAMDNATAWTSTVLGEIDHSQAFTFHHKNLLGQNHKDNQFGSGNDSNPAQQNAFLAALQNYGVRYDMSGHDHMNHRSIVTSPDGLSKVQEIICQSDSTKFYIASSGFSSREQSISDQQLKIGYYTFTVDGPKVTGRYYTADKDTPDSNQNGTIVANPVWTLQDTFGYSLNGKQTTVPRGGSYAGITDTTAKAVANGETGYQGAAMSILSGTNSITGTAEGNRAEVDDLNTGWAPKSGSLVSDVLSLWGMNNALGSAQTDTFTLSLSYNPAASNPLLVSRDGGTWVNAVTGNTGGTHKCVGDRPFNAATDTLGTYGYDSATHTAWAVINHNSDFAVAPGTPTNIQIGSNTYVQYSTGLTANTKVWLNFDGNPDNTPIRATQRFLGYHEVDYKGLVSEKLQLNAVTPTTTGGVTTYDYSTQSSKSTYLAGFWADKNLPIIIGPDGKAYITDGHHTTAGYLAANVASRYIIPDYEHVVMGTIVANYYDAAASSHPTPDDTWWLARESENNTLLYGINGNQLTRSADPGYAGFQPILPSVQPMPLIPGKAGMADEALRSVAWGMADGIVKSATNSGGTRLTGYSKASTTHSGDTNFVEFYWCDFLRNRITWDDSKTGSALSTTNADRNLIQAPLGFYAAVANGIALAKSEVYRDQYGRTLADYNSDLSAPNTKNWAIDSTSSGRLAAATDTYNMYLLDDSSVVGDITPSLLSQAKNMLHIDTSADQTISGVIANFGKSVDINKGSSIATQWKDAVLNNTTYNSTLTITPGTGRVTFTGANTYTGKTNIGAGTLALGATGSIDSSAGVTVAVGATFDTTAKSTYAMPAGQTYAISIDGTGSGSSGRINASGLDISNASVSFNIVNPLDDTVYVIGSYTSLTGTAFASVSVPSGYALNYTYNGDQIALVSSYAAWTAANASGQDADQDTNHTGVPNGIRYFMGATGSSPVANPGIVNGAVTWPKSQLFLGTYVIEVSSDLAAWEPATTDYASYITDNGTSVVFTLPLVPGKIFTRLRVTPAP